MDVPADAGIGSYEAAIRIVSQPTGEVTTVPVLVNVAARGPDLVFGGNFPSDDLYDNDRIFGGYDRSLLRNNIERPHLGDRRFYYFDIPDQGLFAWSRGMKLFLDAGWIEKPSDLDLHVLGKRLADDASKSNATHYGPYTLGVAGESEVQDEPAFHTSTNTSEEVITVDLRAGLNVLIVKGVALSGAFPYELVDGTLGWIRAPAEVDVATKDLAGREPVHVLSNVDFPSGLTASAVGPAITEAQEDLEVDQDFQDWMFGALSWGEIVRMGSFSWCIELEKALILEVHIAGHGNAPDLDLGVFRNLDGDCTYNEDEDAYETELTDEEVDVANAVNLGGNLWFWDADADADETVKWVAPPDGQYVIRVLGFTTIGGKGTFDMEIAVTLDTGKGYEVAEAREPDDLLVATIGGLGPQSLLEFNMTWDFPGDTKDGNYGGAVLVGTPLAPGILVLPAVVSIDRSPPTIFNFVVNPHPGFDLEATTKAWTNDPAPDIGVSLSDTERGEMVFETAQIWVNGMNVTAQATVSIPQSSQDDKLGFWSGSITYTPNPLPDGTYVVVLRLADRARNWVEAQHHFVVDTEAPLLTLDGAAVEYTASPTATLRGTASPSATVLAPGGEVTPDATGRFQFDVALVEGANEIAVQAVDWFGADPGGNPIPGNVAEATKTVVYDVTPPELSTVRLLSADPTPLGVVEVTGVVSDDIAPGVAQDPTMVTVTVGGIAANVRPDGSFSAFVSLQEGVNAFDVVATDLSGNLASLTRSIVRDSLAPALTVETVPDTVSQRTLTLRGTVSGQATLTLNGDLVLAPGGAFEETVELSRGLNILVLEAVDSAGNPTERRIAVSYAPPASGVGPLGWVLLPVLLILGILLGLFALPRLFGPAGLGEEEEEEEPEEEELPLEEEEMLPEEEWPEEEEAPAVEEIEEEVPPLEKTCGSSACGRPTSPGRSPNPCTARTSLDWGSNSRRRSKRRSPRSQNPRRRRLPKSRPRTFAWSGSGRPTSPGRSPNPCTARTWRAWASSSRRKSRRRCPRSPSRRRSKKSPSRRTGPPDSRRRTRRGASPRPCTARTWRAWASPCPSRSPKRRSSRRRFPKSRSPRWTSGLLACRKPTRPVGCRGRSTSGTSPCSASRSPKKRSSRRRPRT